MSDNDSERRAILKQREKAEIKRLGLPYLEPGMSHNAVAVQLKRATRSMEVRQRILNAWEEEKRALQQAPPSTIDTVDKAARAERFLKTKAHPLVKQKVLELAGATSEFKARRSRKPNGF